MLQKDHPTIVNPWHEYLSNQEFQNLLAKGTFLNPKVGHFEPEPGLYLIPQGKIRLLDQNDKQLLTLAAGDYFGEFSLFDDNLFSYKVRVSLDVSLFFIPNSNLQPFLSKYPAFKEHLWQKGKKINNLVPTDNLPLSKVVAKQPEITLNKEEGDKIYFPSASQKIDQWLRKTIKRYPFFAQQSASDCGAACLVMVSRYWQKKSNINRLREIADVNRDGASLKGLIRAAESIGLAARPVKASLEGLSKQNLPAIAHWEGKHFIVVWEITKKEVIISDPGIGQLNISRSEFIKKWTGYSLLLEPTVQFHQQKDQKTSFWQFFELLKPHSLIILEIFLASIFIQAFGLITPIFTQIILDRVVVQGSSTTLFAMGLGLLIFGVFKVAIMGLRTYLLDYTANRLDLALITGFIHHVLRLPLAYFESRYVGDIISRVGENRKIQRFLSGEALSIFLDSLTVFVYIGLMFKYNWQLALLGLTIIPPFLILSLVSTPFLQRISREIFNAVAKESSYLIEILTGISTVKSTASEQSVRWHWEEFLSEEVKKEFSGQIISNQLQTVSHLIESLATTALLWFGAYLVINNQLTIGQMVAFNMLFAQVISPFQRLTVLWNQFQEVNIAFERISDVFEAKPEEDLNLSSRQMLPPTQGNIIFDKVTFRYHSESDKNILENLSFRIKSGQTVALVGRSGSGKTTITKLLLGLYPPTDGKILIDGYDTQNLVLSSLRKQIGVVDQDTFLFGATIRENITLGKTQASLTEVIEATKLAGIHDFIISLPMGYETQIGEGGGLLSGGQRQRIAIARALIDNPKILLLDEATSHLDAESERIIQNNLNKIRENRTILIIAHRLSTIRNADLILVLDKGLLAETGTHEKLMKQGGLYAHLNRQQIP